MRPVCTASQPPVTEVKFDLGIKVSLRCTSKVSSPVTTTTVLATIDMPEYKGVNMSGTEEFDLVINDRIPLNDTEGCKDIVRDLGNLKMGNSV